MVVRCAWVANYGEDDLMTAYHDHEWGRPTHGDQQLFELLSLETYQAGLSWQTVLHKRAAFRIAFAQYDIDQVAQMTATDIDRLLQNTDIIRHRQKLTATIANAQGIQRIQHDYGSFDAWLWSFVQRTPIDNRVIDYTQMPSSTDLSKSVSKAMKAYGFKFVGPVTVYSFMQAAGLINDHELTCEWHG